MSEPLLAASGLCKAYSSGSGPIDVLRDLNLVVDAEEAVAVVGDSGVGKSTLLHLIGGLTPPDRGRVTFRGDNVYGGPAARLADYRNRNVGFVFQFHHLLPEFTALENVEMPLRIRRQRTGIEKVAREILVRLGLENRLHHLASHLSGGEQQRVAIARAVVGAPSLVLADEPTGNLDPGTGRRIFELFRELQRERSFALVLVSHNERLARGCDRLLRLEEGILTPLADSEASEYFSGTLSERRS